jgi:hypothetical protein
MSEFSDLCYHRFIESLLYEDTLDRSRYTSLDICFDTLLETLFGESFFYREIYPDIVTYSDDTIDHQASLT